MAEEEKKDPQAKTAEVVLPCGHTDSFEHRLVEGILTIANTSNQLGMPAIEPCMEYVRHAMEYCYIPIPTIEEINKITMSHNTQSKEVH